MIDLETLYTTESRHVLATLIRLLGDFELAEDALHEAFLAAAEQWPQTGVPRNPRSWLISAGRFRAIDAIRRRARYDAHVQRMTAESKGTEEMHVDFEHVQDDDLRLIFLCAHPSLSLDAQIALTLREACGLTTEEIARAFLAMPSAVAQRIVRAKAKLREAGIAYELPTDEELPQRLASVLHVLYLLFNEGYDASFGPSLLRADLCAEAIRLARLVARALPDAEAYGLLALMMFHHARRRARTNAQGELILLEDQDRSLWDRVQIAEATGVLARALADGSMGRYTCEASIAQTHAKAARADETNWARIVRLYDILLALEPTPIVELNRAAAIAMRDGPAAGLAIMETLVERDGLREYRFAHAARADLYRRLGRFEEARAAYEVALRLTTQDAERRYLTARLASVSSRA
jgi:RNA polymerase sigma-70 factor, ECF subfamily